ncbi:MAG: hypothetical protein FWE60_01265 [Oscillospiraceae bacterium]|nr:hypothetical protein [Oscillospiraceae bacterium]
MKKLIKKTAVFIIIAAVIFAGFPATASAATIDWNGTAALMSGNTYTIRNQLRISSDLTIPEGVTLNVRSGASLLLTSGMTLIIRGGLSISSGGELEIRNAKLNTRGTGKLDISGSVLQYTDTEINIFAGDIIINPGGSLTSSGLINMYSDSRLNSRGSVTLTPSSVMTVSGTVTNRQNAQISVRGNISVTTSGTMTSAGSISVSGSGALRNSGIFTLERGAEFINNGTFSNTARGLFTDYRVRPDFDKMTSAILENEPVVSILGIDVSVWQHEINWEQVALSGVKFAMIRAARGSHSPDVPIAEDVNFRRNIRGAAAAGLDVGVYFYSYAETVEEARAEAFFLVELLKNERITYPVVFDIEDPMHKDMSKTLLTAITEAFIQVIMENGYFPMIYSYKNFLEDKIDRRVLDKYTVWLAHWNETPTYQGRYYMWQYTDKGRVWGIEGDVDLNVSYRDFAYILRKHGLNHLR